MILVQEGVRNSRHRSLELVRRRLTLRGFNKLKMSVPSFLLNSQIEPEK